MENIKSVVACNLIKLRKQNNLTQAELSKKLNYSDKAVSRWESGDVTPDVETLNKIAEVYNVNLTALFDENLDLKNAEKLTKREEGNRRAIVLLSVSFVWILVILIYVYIHLILEQSYWQVFVYGIPATCLVALVFNFIWGTRLWKFIILSVLSWTLLVSFYILFLKYNVWLIFLLGAPIQIAIYLWSTIKTKKHIKNNGK